VRVSRSEFEELVEEALAGMPEDFREKLENLDVFVEDRPSLAERRELGLSPGQTVLGVYRGTPLRYSEYGGRLELPNSITIYQKPIERICRSRQAIVHQVRRTVLHEVGHHFGMSEARLRELGY
jgi:predicted Zn-dependent protease with MMP-like domain